jgi:hypothetical protein
VNSDHTDLEKALENRRFDYQSDGGDELEVPSNVPSRRLYRAVEHQELSIPLGEMLVGNQLDLYSEVTGKGYIKAYIKGKNLCLQAGGIVGQIPLNDRVLIEVSPRASVKNLTRVLLVAGSIKCSPMSRQNSNKFKIGS